MKNKAEAKDIVAAGVQSGSDAGGASIDAPFYTAEFECIGPDGMPKWKTKWKNLVTTAGKTDLLNKYFGCTGAYTAAWYMGLASSNVGGGSAPNVSDVLSNHSWTEATAYGTQRPALVWASTYAGVTTASTSCAYAFTGAQSVGGAFICNVSATSSNGAGILYSDNTFAATRAVSNGDTLNVTVTVSFA
jgi:hypothetical protein